MTHQEIDNKDKEGQDGKKTHHEPPEKKAKKNKGPADPNDHITQVIGKPKETLLQFALSALKLVRPRMNVEKDLEGQPDLIPTDSEMLLSIAKLITKINLCATDSNPDNFLDCVYLYTWGLKNQSLVELSNAKIANLNY